VPPAPESRAALLFYYTQTPLADKYILQVLIDRRIIPPAVPQQKNSVAAATTATHHFQPQTSLISSY
jgi:hypothetical protein